MESSPNFPRTSEKSLDYHLENGDKTSITKVKVHFAIDDEWVAFGFNSPVVDFLVEERLTYAYSALFKTEIDVHQFIGIDFLKVYYDTGKKETIIGELPHPTCSP